MYNYDRLIGDSLKLDPVKPLEIAPEIFLENYNLPIDNLVEHHSAKENNQKGGKSILYLSYSHALRLLRIRHPDLDAHCVMNPATGGYLFTEVDRRGYFMLSYVSSADGRRSSLYYNAYLTMSGQGVHPDDVKADKNGQPKSLNTGELIPLVDSQGINKLYYRSLTKAIGLATGLGLKLWTGDDLSQEIIDEKNNLLMQVQALGKEYTTLTGEAYPGIEELDIYASSAAIKAYGKALHLKVKELKNNPVIVVPEPPTLILDTPNGSDEEANPLATSSETEPKKTTRKKM